MLNLSHKKLNVYQMALNLLTKIYELTKSFPKGDQFALISQLRRAAISVCSNIAEEASRRSNAEKLRFYEVSRSSAVEIDSQFEISLRLKHVTKNQILESESCLESVFRILSKLISNLEPH